MVTIVMQERLSYIKLMIEKSESFRRKKNNCAVLRPVIWFVRSTLGFVGHDDWCIDSRATPLVISSKWRPIDLGGKLTVKVSV